MLNSFQHPCAVIHNASVARSWSGRAWMLKQSQHDALNGGATLDRTTRSPYMDEQ